MPELDNPNVTPSGDLGVGLLEREEIKLDKGWNTILWNDPVNNQHYVTATLVKVLEITPEKAEQYMLIAHNEGKAAVFNGTREEAENKVTLLHSATLNATAECA